MFKSDEAIPIGDKQAPPNWQGLTRGIGGVDRFDGTLQMTGWQLTAPTETEKLQHREAKLSSYGSDRSAGVGQHSGPFPHCRQSLKMSKSKLQEYIGGLVYVGDAGHSKRHITMDDQADRYEIDQRLLFNPT